MPTSTGWRRGRRIGRHPGDRPRAVPDRRASGDTDRASGCRTARAAAGKTARLQIRRKCVRAARRADGRVVRVYGSVLPAHAARVPGSLSHFPAAGRAADAPDRRSGCRPSGGAAGQAVDTTGRAPVARDRVAWRVGRGVLQQSRASCSSPARPAAAPHGRLQSRAAGCSAARPAAAPHGRLQRRTSGSRSAPPAAAPRARRLPGVAVLRTVHRAAVPADLPQRDPRGSAAAKPAAAPPARQHRRPPVTSRG